MKRVCIKVSGDVQGVGFRRYTLDKANALGLTGYVGNLDDGRVEILAQGSDLGILQLIDWCHHGSPSASVSHVEVDEDLGDEFYLGFSIIAL
ncbi:MAG: acylphosphatase [Shewanella sp.]|nr:acylphosphatase [Shewanella sp.]MCF1429986.1 acylphosphatase [Shewanella sp.]MCF1438985.1 acylphosphatase [Shewanella sp.]MCF1457772.1 acylphosphatase [Shewanella sp.]